MQKSTQELAAWYISHLHKIAIFFAAFYLIIKRSWVGEDAFIFFKYVDNFVNGHGLVFNVGERVEGFTSALWVFVLALIRGMTGFELRPTAIILGIILSLIAVGFLILKDSKSVFFPITVILLITNSAFRDFATSGFETSLTYVLLILVLLCVKKDLIYKRPFLTSTIVALLVLNRPEAFLILGYVGLLVLLEAIRSKSFTLLIKFAIPVVLLVGGYQIFRMG